MPTVLVVTPPAVEPVSIETAKLHLRVDSSAEDALITAYIVAARERAEIITRRALITQTLKVIYDDWPGDAILALPKPPLQSVSSIKYLDADGVEHSWTDYQVDARSQPGVIYFRSLPGDDLYPHGAIAIQFVAGYGVAAANVPEVIKQGILSAVATWYETRDMTLLPAATRAMFLSQRVTWF